MGHARLRDLAIVPAREGQSVDIGEWYVEEIIFGSRRPTFITPTAANHRGAFTLNTVIVAWDFSRPAARVLANAIPILAMAKRAHVVTVTGDKVINTMPSGSELAEHLAIHGVTVTWIRPMPLVVVSVTHSSRMLLHATPTFLLWEAYGHSRVRDFILGGATKCMLSPLFGSFSRTDWGVRALFVLILQVNWPRMMATDG